MIKNLLVVSILLQTIAVYAQWTIFNSSNSNLPDNSIRCLARDSSGHVWIGTDNGLAKWDGSTFVVTDSSNSSLPSNQIRSIAVHADNSIWIGTLQAGFTIWDTAGWTIFNTQNSTLPDDQVRSITFDQNGIAWLGTGGGIVQLDEDGWIIYNMFNSPLAANNINQVYIDKNDHKWFGTVNGGISTKQGNTWTTYTNTNSGLADNTVFNFSADSLGNLWFSTPAQGLGMFNGNAWFYRATLNSNIPTNAITYVLVEPKTNYKYIGTFDNGLVRWDNSMTFDSFTVVNSAMPDNHITTIMQLNDSTLLIGTQENGLVVFTDPKLTATPTGIANLTENKIKARVYPNPTYGRVSIYSDSGVRSIQITDVSGKLLLTQQNTNSINLSDLQPGLYIVHVMETNDTQSIHKVIRD